MSRDNKHRVKHKTDTKIEPLFIRWKNKPYNFFLNELKNNKCISKKAPKYEGRYDFRFVNMKKTRLTDAKINNACLDSIKAYCLYMNNSEIENCLVANGDFNSVNITKTKIENSQFYSCDFENSEFNNVSMCNSIFKSCVFNDSVFRSIDVENAILDNSDFTDLKNPENSEIDGVPKSVKNAVIDQFTFIMLGNSEFKKQLGREGVITYMNKTDYDVALSFAGEQRDYVEKVAEYLRVNHIRVFYDDFEKADLWGKDLVTHLTELYSDKAKYVIVFASEEYVSKFWTNIERRAVLARFLNGNYEKVLLVKMDEAKIPGFTDIKGYLDSSVLNPEEIGDLFISKLKQSY